MIPCTCYMTAMLLVGKRLKRRIGAPIAVSRAPALSYAHNTLLVTGTQSSATCGAAAANHAARGIAVQNGTQPVSDLTHPQRLGLGNTCLAMMDWPHTYPAWCVFLLTCSTKAAFVGGRYSKVRDD